VAVDFAIEAPCVPRHEQALAAEDLQIGQTRGIAASVVSLDGILPQSHVCRFRRCHEL
jgi:hypothetical protein